MVSGSPIGYYFTAYNSEILFKVVGHAYGSVYICRNWFTDSEKWRQRPEYGLVDLAEHTDRIFYRSKWQARRRGRWL